MMIQAILGVALITTLLPGCGNFLGRTGEQMSDQPRKEKEQAQTAKEYERPARTRNLRPGP
jgi:hypothetical protein